LDLNNYTDEKNKGYWKKNDRQRTIQVAAKKNGTVRHVVLWVCGRMSGGHPHG
jgi:uncharacterized protein with GYD domain